MIHHIFANRYNIGDWLSARGIQSLLAPSEISEHLCDEAFAEETLLALSTAEAGDLAVIGGGGLFMDYFEPFWRGLLQLADRLPYCIWSVGFCDLKREATLPSQQLIEEVVSRSQLCIVRDELSRRLLARFGLEDPVPCPSIAAVEQGVAPGHGVLHVDNLIPVGDEVYEAMVSSGREFASNTGRLYRSTNNCLSHRGGEQGLARVLDLYAKSDVVLSSRLHGCVIGVAMGRKVLAVSGDHKVESFMGAAGLAEWVCDLQEANSVPERLKRLDDQPSAGDFVESARGQNERVSKRVLEIYRELSGRRGLIGVPRRSQDE